MAAYTIEMWLRGMVDFDFSAEAINAICFNRGCEVSDSVYDITVKTRELCYADLLMYAAGSSVQSSGEYISDNGYQLQKSAKNVYDRDALRDIAKRIYEKYNDARADESTKGTTMRPLY